MLYIIISIIKWIGGIMDIGQIILWVLYGVLLAQLSPIVFHYLLVELPVKVKQSRNELINKQGDK